MQFNPTYSEQSARWWGPDRARLYTLTPKTNNINILHLQRVPWQPPNARKIGCYVNGRQKSQLCNVPGYHQKKKCESVYVYIVQKRNGYVNIVWYTAPLNIFRNDSDVSPLRPPEIKRYNDSVPLLRIKNNNVTFNKNCFPAFVNILLIRWK